MKLIIHIFILFPVFFFSAIKGNSQTDWQVLNSGVSVNLYGVYFHNLNTGYVCGSNGTILKTTNAGLNWNPLNTSVTYQLNDICFADNLTGYCCGSSGVIKTTNSGVTWFSIFNISTNKICYTEGIIYTASQNGVYKSTNFGLNWFNVYSITSGYLRGLFFNNSDTGYVMGGNMGIQGKTTNGGIFWYPGGVWSPGEYTFWECYFFKSDTGCAGYSFNSGPPYYNQSYGILKATLWSNGQSSWVQVHSSTNMGIRGMTFSGSEDTGYAVGGGLSGSTYQSRILKTINRGSNWFIQSFVIDHILEDVYFIDSRHGFAVGREGIIIKTDNGGVVGLKILATTIPSNSLLYQNYPNPFNPKTKIKFEISPVNPPLREGDKEGVVVKLIIYDILGQGIALLVNEQLKPGIYEVEWDATDYPSGVYYYQLTAGNFRETKRMVLIK